MSHKISNTKFPCLPKPLRRRRGISKMTRVDVIPAEAGNQKKLDSRLRGNDRRLPFLDILVFEIRDL